MKKKNDLIFKLLGITLFGYMLLSLARTSYLNYTTNREITNLENEIVELEKSNQKIQTDLEYYKSDAYKERVARQRLGLKKPGEEVIVVVPDESGEKKEEKPPLPNYRKWWEFIAGRSSG